MQFMSHTRLMGKQHMPEILKDDRDKNLRRLKALQGREMPLWQRTDWWIHLCTTSPGITSGSAFWPTHGAHFVATHPRIAFVCTLPASRTSGMLISGVGGAWKGGAGGLGERDTSGGGALFGGGGAST